MQEKWAAGRVDLGVVAAGLDAEDRGGRDRNDPITGPREEAPERRGGAGGTGSLGRRGALRLRGEPAPHPVEHPAEALARIPGILRSMLDILPFLLWLAAATSAVLLVALWGSGELGPRRLAAVLGWFLAAAYCQFLGGSPMVAAVGLLLQTLLAIYLLLRFRLTG